MTKEFSRTATIIFFIISALTIVLIIVLRMPWEKDEEIDVLQTRIIIPQAQGAGEAIVDFFDVIHNGGDLPSLKAPLEENEVLVSVITGEFEGEYQEEQFVAFRNILETDGPIYISYVIYDYAARRYRRIWTAPTAATVPGTVTLFTRDLTGDRGLCVILMGMNNSGEHTLTAFKRNQEVSSLIYPPLGPVFFNIAEIQVESSIVIRETQRSQVYQPSMIREPSYVISAYDRDYASANIMDQIEYIYSFNEDSKRYEQSSINRIPGIRIEQQRVQALLGNRPAFEDFINGLWYNAVPQSDVSDRLYIYFDPQNRKIIFYGDDTQQIFNWNNSNVTRYGLFISSFNNSLTTLRRTIDISLESLDSIQIKVFEEARQRFGTSLHWDGSYRRVNQTHNQNTVVNQVNNYISAVYDSPIGRFIFSPDGILEISTGASVRRGSYIFLNIEGQELLELRSNDVRETYIVASDDHDQSTLRRNLTLTKVRLGSRGIEQLHEGMIALILAGE